MSFGLSKRLGIRLGCYDTCAEEHVGGEDCRDDRANARYELERKGFNQPP